MHDGRLNISASAKGFGRERQFKTLVLIQPKNEPRGSTRVEKKVYYLNVAF